jgi:hypothetical protein
MSASVAVWVLVPLAIFAVAAVYVVLVGRGFNRTVFRSQRRRVMSRHGLFLNVVTPVPGNDRSDVDRVST